MNTTPNTRYRILYYLFVFCLVVGMKTRIGSQSNKIQRPRLEHSGTTSKMFDI
jgi:hypothetical protein